MNENNKTKNRKESIRRYLNSFGVHFVKVWRYAITKINTGTKSGSFLFLFALNVSASAAPCLCEKSQFHLMVCDINWIKNSENWATRHSCKMSAWHVCYHFVALCVCPLCVHLFVSNLYLYVCVTRWRIILFAYKHKAHICDALLASLVDTFN